ncbi:MAG: D-Ala-D-Ala carboxypeptidase family metallohydrolase [Acidobacteriota bacterium]|nr:D-Ala-D-Ala carboxypeptidase family metallohydrolase [Acidobacteriota bacterium]
MKKTLNLLLLCSLATVALGDAREGSRIQLESLPPYVQHLFVPIVPQAENTVEIGNLPIDEVVEVPEGFDVRVRHDGLVAYSDGGEHAGYARVRSGNRELTLALANVVPYDRVQNGVLDGYKLGEYSAPLKGMASYAPPKGFVRLSNANATLQVSDHYRLKDFQCKLDGSSKFLILRTEALLKLEILQHELEEKHGLTFDRFTVMSGFRTPYYNARIGNETSYSRHLYGDAMDVFIDTDGDGNMDDVNRDGHIDAGDAKFILGVAEELDQSREWGWLKGGAGVYHANSAHGPYIHVDARGYVARWGV